MIPLLHVHVTQPRRGRSEATAPRQATFLGLNGRFIREFGENRVRMGRFWSISAGNAPKIGPVWADSGRRTVCDCGAIDGGFSEIRPFSEIDSRRL